MSFIYKTFVMWAPGLLEHAVEVNAHTVGRELSAYIISMPTAKCTYIC